MKRFKCHKKQQAEKYNLNGSSTIEVALIMPMLLMVIFLIIYLTLFLYGKAQLTRNAYVSVLRASQAEWDTSRKKESIANQAFMELQNESYLEGLNVKKDIQIKEDFVTISIDFGQNISSAVFLEEGFERKAFTGSMRYKAKTNHPVSFIWNCRKLESGIRQQTQNEQTKDVGVKRSK